LRGFLCLCGYYRRFIRGYSFVSAPLTKLTKKNDFNLDESAQRAFEQLKRVLITPPVLALPDFNLQFIIKYDASATRVGAMVMQKNHPIAFISQELKSPEKWSSAYER